MQSSDIKHQTPLNIITDLNLSCSAQAEKQCQTYCLSCVSDVTLRYAEHLSDLRIAGKKDDKDAKDDAKTAVAGKFTTSVKC